MPTGGPMNARTDTRTMEQARAIMGDKLNFSEPVNKSKHSYKDILETGSVAYDDLSKTHTNLGRVSGWELPPLTKVGQKQKPLSEDLFKKIYRSQVLNMAHHKIISTMKSEPALEAWQGGGPRSMPFDLNVNNVMTSNNAVDKIDNALGEWFNKSGGQVEAKDTSRFVEDWSNWVMDPKSDAYKIVDLEVGGINLEKLDSKKQEKINNLREQWSSVEADPEVRKKAWESGNAWEKTMGVDFMPERESLISRRVSPEMLGEVWKIKEGERPKINYTESGEAFTKAFDLTEGPVNLPATVEDYLYDNQIKEIRKLKEKGESPEKIAQQAESYKIKNQISEMSTQVGEVNSKLSLEELLDPQLSQTSRGRELPKIKGFNKIPSLRGKASGLIPNFATQVFSKALIPNFKTSWSDKEIKAILDRQGY